MKKLIFIFSLIGIISLWGCKKEKKEQSTKVPTPTYEDTIMPPDTPFKTDSTTIDTSVVIKTEDTTGKLHKVDSVKITDNQKIYVIVGSFTKYNNAQKKLNYLKQKGYSQAKILPKYGKYHRVAVEGYTNEKNARTGLIKYRKLFKDNKIWLLLR